MSAFQLAINGFAIGDKKVDKLELLIENGADIFKTTKVLKISYSVEWIHSSADCLDITIRE
jgi:hypothetical protein